MPPIDLNPLTWPQEWQIVVAVAAGAAFLLGLLIGRATKSGGRAYGPPPQRGAYADYARDERAYGPPPPRGYDERAYRRGGEDGEGGEGWEGGEGGERGKKRKRGWDFDD